MTLNWVSHLQLTWVTHYCTISIYLLCMCIHTYHQAHPVGSRFLPYVMWILGTELLSSGLCDKCFIQWTILLSILLLLLVSCFWDRVSLHNPIWPGICYVNPASLENSKIRDSPTSVSSVIALKAWTTTDCLFLIFYLFQCNEINKHINVNIHQRTFN